MQNTLSLTRPVFLVYRLFPKISLGAVWLLVSLSVILLLAFYIFQVNSFTQERYSFRNYQRELAGLLAERENLEINFSKFNSLANIEDYLLNQNFEKASRVKYIQILENQVVKR